MSKRRSILALAVCSVLLLSACSSKGDSEEKAAERQAVNVEIAQAQTGSLDALSSLSGKLEPMDEISISFEIGGVIEKMNVDVGDSISSGQVLATLKTTDVQFQVDQAKNAVLQAEAGLLSANSSVNAAQANIEAANAQINSANASLKQVNDGARKQEKEQARLNVENAKASYNKLQKDFERTKTLYEQGFVSLSEYEAMKLQLENAEKSVRMAEESYSLVLEGATEAQRAAAQASVKQAEVAKTQAEAAKKQAEAGRIQAQAAYDSAQITLKQAEQSLAKAQLKAPFSSVVLSKEVSAGVQVGSGESVYTIGNIQQLKVLLPVPDQDIKNWAVGNEVTVMLYDEKRTGKVSKIYPMTNAGTGTVNVEVVIPNEKMDWIPGQIVKANLVRSDNVGILVPIAAVLSTGADPYVFKVVDGKAVKTPVETGKLVENQIHIVSGLEEGEEIVVRGGELLLDGDPVNAGGGKEE